MPVFYEDRRYWAMRSARRPRLGTTIPLLIAKNRQDTEVAIYDPVFAFSDDQLVTQYEVVDPGPSWFPLHSIDDSNPNSRRWVRTVSAKVIGTQADSLRLVVPTDKPAHDFVLRFGRRQVISEVLGVLDKHESIPEIAYPVPNKIGDLLLDAFQLPWTDYHWGEDSRCDDRGGEDSWTDYRGGGDD